MPSKKSVYQLKISLKDIKPPIWRRLLLPSDATFWELHIAITLPYPEYDLFGEIEPLDESKTLLYNYLSERQPKINYVYDFGDNWEHQIVLEKILPFNSKETYPRVIGGKRACPWEDSGGPGGYEDKIEILKDKKHEEHAEIADWVWVDDFNELDLESFNPNDVIFRNPATELRRAQKAIEREFPQTAP